MADKYWALIAHLRECASYDASENTFSAAADAIEELLQQRGDSDYVSREDAKNAAALIALTSAKREMTCGEVKRIMKDIHPADVRPVALINAGIETALQILDGINEEGLFPYPVYSELHDAISVIGEYAQSGADMREATT